jgi:hypothetical protein
MIDFPGRAASEPVPGLALSHFPSEAFLRVKDKQNPRSPGGEFAAVASTVGYTPDLQFRLNHSIIKPEGSSKVPSQDR